MASAKHSAYYYAEDDLDRLVLFEPGVDTKTDADVDNLEGGNAAESQESMCDGDQRKFDTFDWKECCLRGSL